MVHIIAQVIDQTNALVGRCVGYSRQGRSRACCAAICFSWSRSRRLGFGASRSRSGLLKKSGRLKHKEAPTEAKFTVSSSSCFFSALGLSLPLSSGLDSNVAGPAGPHLMALVGGLGAVSNPHIRSFLTSPAFVISIHK